MVFLIIAGIEQIWIAGGVGVVPFLAWISAIKRTSSQRIKIEFYRGIHMEADAAFHRGFKELSVAYPDFQIFCVALHKQIGSV